MFELLLLYVLAGAIISALLWRVDNSAPGPPVSLAIAITVFVIALWPAIGLILLVDRDFPC